MEEPQSLKQEHKKQSKRHRDFKDCMKMLIESTNIDF
jgi:hypothetical protein